MASIVPENRTVYQAQAQRLAAYIPVTLVRQILVDGLPTPGQPQTLTAATLFADISGFTAMSENLAADGPRGAEEVNRVLLQTFTAMIDVIHRLGGAIAHFYGDAMSVYFPEKDGQAAIRALVCAQQMQRLILTRFQSVQTSRPAGKNPTFPLTMKIGVGYGRCQEWVLGNPQNSLEFVLSGQAIDEATQAEKQAAAGQIVASRSVFKKAGLPCHKPFHLLEVALPAPKDQPLLDWSAYTTEGLQRLIEAATPFIPRALQQRLVTPGLEVLAEHRPVTSLFLQFDLAEKVNPEGDLATGERLQKYYTWACQVVSRFGQSNGRVNRVLTGDKGNQLHIIFGAPVAPDAPEQAIRCALALQRERPDFIAVQRIGLCTGKVFAGPVGSESRREYTVVGDVVNLSARLMAACDPGEVLTDENTAERVSNLMEFEGLPACKVKGMTTEVIPHRALGERAVLAQLQAYFTTERPLIGRDVEMEMLQDAMHAARQGSGGIAAIFGGAGVGKTRLLGEIVRRWQADGGTVLMGICHPHTADTPYSSWQTIWQAIFNLAPSMDPTAQAAAVQQVTLTLWPNAGDDVGLWAEVLNLPIAQVPELAELTAEARQARFFTMVQRCLQAYNQPLLLVLENIHWADQATLALIDYLTPHLHQSSMYIAFTFRDSALDSPLAALESEVCIPVTLSDLSPRHARHLLQELVGVRNLPPAVEQQLGLRDREGRDSPVNPLFLEEAVNVMLDIGVLGRDNGRLQVNESLLTRMQVPDTIHGLLLARLDRLPPASRDLLQVASVIGRQFGVEPLRFMMPGLSVNTVNDLLSSLSAEEMTRLVTSDPEWIYLFQHAMTHEVAYESLPYVRRQDLHAGLAAWLEEAYADNLKPINAILAYHYSRANNHLRALQFALAGAQDARDVYANGDAVELYTLAEKHLLASGAEDPWETAVTLYLSRGEVSIILGNLAGALNDAQQALRLAKQHGDYASASRANTLMAEIHYRQGLFDEVLALAGQVVNQEAAPPDQLMRAYLWAGWAASSKREYQTALDSLRRAEALCQQHSNNYLLARVMEALAFVYYSQKELDLALEAMLRGVQLSRRFSTPLNIGIAISNVAFVQFTLGHPENALKSINEAVELGRSSGDNLLAHALGNRAVILAYLGQFTAAKLDFEEAVGLLHRMNYPSLLVETYLFWGYEYSSPRGEWAEAQQQLSQAQALIETQPDSYPEEKFRLLIGLAQLALHDGHASTAVALLAEAKTAVEAMNFSWWRPAVHYFWGLAAQERGETAVAEQHWHTGLEAIDANGSPDYKPLILLALGQQATDPMIKDSLLAKAIAAARQRARYIDRKHCLLTAGALLVKSPRESMRRLGHESVKEAQAM